MKRQVYVPFQMMENGDIPQEALDLSRETMLPIRIGEADENIISSIDVINVPETNFLSYKEIVKSGFIQIFDYTNEYTDLSEGVYLAVSHEDGEKSIIKPRIKEKHILRYRNRFYKPGKYSFYIKQGDNSVLNQGTFVVV